MAGSWKGSCLVDLVAGCLPSYPEEELYPVQLLSVSIRCRKSVNAAYLFPVGLPCPAERCLRRSSRRLGEAHNQVHLDIMSAFHDLHKRDHDQNSGKEHERVH